jgi:hypothetical protein
MIVSGEPRMREFAANILCPNLLTSKECGERLLNLWIKHFPQHMPDRYGQSEPLRRRFDASKIELVLNDWGHLSFTLARSNPDALVNILFCPPVTSNPRHSSMSLLKFQSENDDEIVRICNFVSEVSVIFDADYSIAHVLTRTELDERLAEVRTATEQGPAFSVRFAEALQRRIQREGHALLSQHELAANIEHVVTQNRGGVEVATRQEERLRLRIKEEGYARVLREMTMLQTQTVHLRKWLKDLYWFTIFGRPYIKMFGRERLLTAPAHEVHELSKGAISIKLTTAIEDTQEDWERFKSVRALCKAHLGSDAFFDRSNPNQIYQVPKFKFPIEMYKPKSSRV